MCNEERENSDCLKRSGKVELNKLNSDGEKDLFPLLMKNVPPPLMYDRNRFVYVVKLREAAPSLISKMSDIPAI